MSLRSYLDLVNECDVLHFSSIESLITHLPYYYTLTCNDTATGCMPGYVVKAFERLPFRLRNYLNLKINHSERKLSLFRDDSSVGWRSSVVNLVCQYWKDHRKFSVLEGWRSELFPVYGHGDELLWSMERSAIALIGVVSYGIHMTAYIRDLNSPHGLKFWVPRRSMNKQTFGGMLDNTVAGGMAVNEDPLTCLVREAEEEAGLQKDLVQEYSKACGTVTYIYLSDSRAGGEAGLVQPECEFIYDLELPKSVVPAPTDGEVDEFYLWSVEEVQAALKRGEFKPNSALVMLDFFIRHKILTIENEPNYEDIKKRIHRDLPFPGPHLKK
ncbi:Uncharacterized protein GcM3_049022 [Golovinomyces cichoracearum]|uniref:Nudix hydrolase domain-containing protein n=1 Tax=Golovinomyces cichoracearum TaxID=62708 RepID=A0A420IZS6_9PEZI|nr:Uncharacterized protein GcM3_049022 [Golovinomyces cichoracearum]